MFESLKRFKESSAALKHITESLRARTSKLKWSSKKRKKTRSSSSSSKSFSTTSTTSSRSTSSRSTSSRSTSSRSTSSSRAKTRKARDVFLNLKIGSKKSLDATVEMLQAVLARSQAENAANMAEIHESAVHLSARSGAAAQAVSSIEAASSLLDQKSKEVAAADLAVVEALQRAKAEPNAVLLQMLQERRAELAGKVAETKQAAGEVERQEKQMEVLAEQQPPEEKGYFQILKEGVSKHRFKILTGIALTGLALMAYAAPTAVPDVPALTAPTAVPDTAPTPTADPNVPVPPAPTPAPTAIPDVPAPTPAPTAIPDVPAPPAPTPPTQGEPVVKPGNLRGTNAAQADPTAAQADPTAAQADPTAAQADPTAATPKSWYQFWKKADEPQNVEAFLTTIKDPKDKEVYRHVLEDTMKTNPEKLPFMYAQIAEEEAALNQPGFIRRTLNFGKRLIGRGGTKKTKRA